MKNLISSLFYNLLSNRRVSLRITCFLTISVLFLLVNHPLTAQSVELGRCSVTQQEEPEIRTPDFHSWDPLGADCAWFNEFKRDISSDPADSHSDEMLKRLVEGNGSIDAQWSGSWTPPEWNWYTLPFQVVSGNTEILTIPGTWAYNPDSTGPYMLPPEPIVYENSTDTTYATSPWTDGADHHLVVFVRDEETGGFKELWEYYKPWVTWNVDQISVVEGASWRRFDLLNGETPAPGVQATDAAGMMIMPLCVRYHEVANGEINHALRFCVNNSDISPTFKWPARNAAAAWNLETGMPYGTRLRIKTSWWDENADSVLGIGTQARIIGEAMRRYGLLLADGSGGTSIQLQGVADLRWETDLVTRLNSIPVSALEVVQTPPLLQITGPTHLEVDETGTWTLTLLPDESPVGVGSNINIYDSTGQLIKYMFATIDEDHRSVVAKYTFNQAGVYTIKAYEPWNTGFGPFRVTVGEVGGVKNSEAKGIKLDVSQNLLNPTKTIKFHLDHPRRIKLIIFNSLGQVVANLADGVYKSGWHTTQWNTFNSGSGLYICTLHSDEIHLTRKIILLR